MRESFACALDRNASNPYIDVATFESEESIEVGSDLYSAVTVVLQRPVWNNLGQPNKIKLRVES